MRVLAVMAWLVVATSAWAQGFYEIKEKDIEGQELPLSNFKGKVVLVVNIASQCGFTPQLEELQALQAKYASRGFTVLGVPSNEFGEQTPENDQGMKEFCQKKYNVNFPLLAKGRVNGPERRPLYQYLLKQKASSGDIGWNFIKIMVNKHGEVIDRWTSLTAPSSPRVITTLEKALE